MRIEGQSKLGYYPTPETSLHRIISWLSLGGDSGALRRYLDPCAGQGEALAAIAAAHGPAETYGIELSYRPLTRLEKWTGVLWDMGALLLVGNRAVEQHRLRHRWKTLVFEGRKLLSRLYTGAPHAVK
jgi:hypothetical protein